MWKWWKGMCFPDHLLVNPTCKPPSTALILPLWNGILTLPPPPKGKQLWNSTHVLRCFSVCGTLFIFLENWQKVLCSQEASSAVPLFSPVLVPMAQSMGPLLSQIASSPTFRLGVRYFIFLWRAWFFQSLLLRVYKSSFEMLVILKFHDYIL